MGSWRLPDSPIREVSDSLTHRYGESATPQLTDAGSRGVYKKKNKSLRSLCVPVVAGISGPAKKILSVGYNTKEFQGLKAITLENFSAVGYNA